MQNDVTFQIEVLQRNKIIMATEAVAVNTSVIIGMFLVDRYVPATLFREYAIIAGAVFGIGFALFASIGNYYKHKKIHTLLEKFD